MTGLVAAVCGVLGLAVGSFLNVVIHRVPRHESVVHPRSRCPSCGTQLAERDNIPVVSWLLLRGRCRTCAAPISARYPAVELLTGLLFLAAGLRFGDSLEVVPYCLGFAGMVALSFIDLDTKLLPKRIVWPLAALVLVGFVVTALVENRWDDLQRALLGAAASTAAIGALWFAYPAGMGFGDVRFELVLGMLLGWLTRGTVVAGMLLAFLLAGVLGIGLIATGVRSRKDAIPFGPWLALGAAVAILVPAVGRWIEDNYVSQIAEALQSAF